MRSCLLVLVLSGLASATGCSRPRFVVAADGQPAPDVLSLPVVSNKATGLLFSFFDQRAELRTVERLEQVLPAARAEVQVTDPNRPLEGDQVFLTDLRKTDWRGQYRVWPDRRGAWLDRVMPRISQLPRSVASGDPGSKAPPKKKVAKKKRRPRPAQGQAQGGQPRVIIFSTAWCPSCKAARAHLTAKGIPFVEADVEKDQQAGAYYQKIIEQHRLKQGVVPLIVVDGKPMQGFSAPQLDAVLASVGLGKK